MSYKVLVLPPGRTMTPALAAKIQELVHAGATVAGPRPVQSPSLANYPQCDDEVERIAAQVWGDSDGATLTENHYGKGKVVWGEHSWMFWANSARRRTSLAKMWR